MEPKSEWNKRGLSKGVTEGGREWKHKRKHYTIPPQIIKPTWEQYKAIKSFKKNSRKQHGSAI